MWYQPDEQGAPLQTTLRPESATAVANVHSVPTRAERHPPEPIEARISRICLSLPGVTERRSHGAPAFFAGNPGKQFLMLWSDGHHDHRFPHLWCAAPPGAQAEMVSTEPDRFFRPPYVGGRGWLGVRLDRDMDWDEMASLCRDAFRAVAPKRLLDQLDAG